MCGAEAGFVVRIKSGQNPIRRSPAVDIGGVVDREHVGVGIDDEFEFGAGEHDGFRPFFFLHRNDGLERAFGIACDPAEHEFLVNDPVDEFDITLIGREQVAQQAAEDALLMEAEALVNEAMRAD